MLSPKKLLENARNRISKRENWTRTALARNSTGHEVAPVDPQATCWCAHGAVAAEAGLNGYADSIPGTHAFEAAEALYEASMDILAEASPRYVGLRSIVQVNDELRHEDVLKMFDTAIANLKGE